MEQLDETNASLRQPARQQTVCRIGARLPCLIAVQFERALRLRRDVGELRNRGLHTERHLILSNSRSDLGIASFFEPCLIQIADEVQKLSPRGDIETRGV